jgi:hypothetical protein
VEKFLREKGADLPRADKDVLLGCTQSRLSLYEYRATRGFFSRPEKGQVRVRDAITGKDFDVTERRHVAGLETGDVLEARLIPFAGHLLFSTAFTFHPRVAVKSIKTEVKRRKKKEPDRPPQELVWECARRAVKVERYKQIAIERIYDFSQNTPWLGSAS